MPLQIGYVDNQGHPRIRIRILGNKGSLERDALIDTGFTGFAMLPKSDALPLGLTVIGTGDYILADGSKVTNPLAEGTVFLGPSLWAKSYGASTELCDAMESTPEHSESVLGAIVLGGDDTLVGMELITLLRKGLAISSDVVALVDFQQLSFLDATQISQMVSDLEAKVNAIKKGASTS